MQYVEAGRNVYIGKNAINKYQRAIQINEINDIIRYRRMKNKLSKSHKLCNTINKIIIEYTIKYTKITQLDRDTLYQINHV